jgi:hypothetical protein
VSLCLTAVDPAGGGVVAEYVELRGASVLSRLVGVGVGR